MLPLINMGQTCCKAILIGFTLLSIHTMAATLSLVLMMGPLGFEMLPLVYVWLAHSRDTQMGFPLLPIDLMGLTLAL